MAEGTLRHQRRDQLFERQILAQLGVEPDLPHPRHDLPHRVPRRQGGAQRQGVDEQADQRLDLDVGAAGDRRADAQVQLPGRACQQRLPCRQEQHGQGGAAVPRQPPRRRGDRRRHLQMLAGAARAAHRRPRPVARQVERRRQPCQLPAPPGQLAFQRVPRQVPALPHRIVGVLDRQVGRSCQALAGLLAAAGVIERPQLADQDAARPGVADDVVDAHQQGVVAGGEPQQHGAQQRSARQVEGAAGFGLCQRRLLGGAARRRQRGQIDRRQRAVRRRRRRQDPLHRRFRDLDEDGAQHLVTPRHGGQGSRQRRGVQRAAQAQGGRHVVQGAAGLQAVEEPQPLLRKGQRQRPVARRRQDRRRRLDRRAGVRRLFDAAGQGGHRRAREDLPQRQLDAEALAHARGEAGGQQRVAAQAEEIVVQAHRVDAHQLGEQGGDHLLGGRHRRPPGRRPRRRCRGRRRRQRAAVDLAAGRQRQPVEPHECRRHHERRQPGGEQAAQVGGVGAGCGAVVVGGVGGGVACQVGDQRLGGAGGGGQRAQRDGGGVHRRMGQQRRFDLPQLDAEAADLHLAVDPPQVVDGAVGQVARQVAGAVQARAARRPAGHAGERVGHEALGGERRPSKIAAADLDAADQQLAGDALRHRVPGRVEQPQPGVRHRAADRHQAPRTVRFRRPAGDVHRRLGRAVQVVQRRPDRRRVLLHQLVGQRLAARHHPPQARQAPRARSGPVGQRVDEGGEHRRHEVQGGDRLGGDGVPQVGRIAVGAGLRHHQAGAGEQRPEQLPDRNVEAPRRLLQHPVVARQAVALLHPQQAVDDAAVGVHRPLGPPGRTRGVDHVRQVVRRRQGRQVALGAAPPAVVVQPERAQLRRQRLAQARGEPALGQQHVGAAVGQHEAQALGRVARIERQVGAARLEDGDQADRGGDRPFGADRRHRLRPHAPAPQLPRHLVGGAVERAEAEAVAGRVGHGDRLRAAPRLLFDQRVQAARAAAGRDPPALPVFPGDLGIVPLQQLLAIARTEQRHVVQAAARVAGERLEQQPVVRRQALDGGGVEQVAAVLEGQLQAGGGVHGLQREVELGRRGVDLAQLQLERAAVRHGDRRHPAVGGVLQHQQGLQQRRRGQVPHRRQLLDQPVEGQLLVREGVQARLAHPRQHRARRRPAGGAGAQRERVDEAADQAFDLQAVAVGDGRAHDDVLLGRPARQQGGEGRQQRHEQRRAGALRRLAHLAGERRRHDDHRAPAAQALRRRPRPIGGQRQTRRRPRQRQPPVAQRSLQPLAGQLGALPGGIVDVLHRQLGQGGSRGARQGGVDGRQLAQEDADGPAVAHDVVQHQDQLVIARPQPRHHGAQQRPARQVEGLAAQPRGQRLRRGGRRRLRRREGGEIHQRRGQCEVRQQL